MSEERRIKDILVNRKARHEFFLHDRFEAGLALLGSEVKSLRAGRANIAESYASEQNGELFLRNAHIAKYESANRFGHEERRSRKLLLRKREINRLIGTVRREGMTLVPLRLYFNERGIAKLTLALAKGKKQYDKRAAEKERSWRREKQRLMREKG